MMGTRSTTALAALLLAACSRGEPEGKAPTIQEVRAQPAGSAVTVEGIVSVPSGVIDAGFAITDGQAGIHVAADSTRRFAAGDRVRVAGTLEEVHGMTSVRPGRVERLGTGKLPPPRVVRTGEVGEATEGLLVRVTGRAVTPLVSDLPYGYKLWVDDGSGSLQLFAAAATGDLGLRQVPVGATVTATGFSAQYDAVYEVIPLARTDVAVAGANP